VDDGKLLPMKKHDAIAALKGQTSAVQALGATALYLFGSTARDTANQSSDLDLFIDYDRDSRFSLIELVGIKQLLEGQLGVAVDITTRDSLDPLLRDRIETSAERIF
jgi:predicted nucleotidyltransferase